ncbi:flagellar basal body L-ring protein FlgH [Hyphomicrobium sp. CS1GBMeth3]|uniref:flagellar basal body L-ring protein FlgH n=1 Tax=Hyphomicrobium sp. CS1GBMeth3 TaxID=1892845 RepID=UPI0009307708|nr:flagellar basal body L-ring protein FlgH [Hyphomicrobium sp. CS1GBMeth3]
MIERARKWTPVLFEAPALAVSVALVALVAGCAVDPGDINRPPALTAVGSGLLADRVPLPAEPAPQPAYHAGNSIWQDASADLFRDPRARKIGDVVTVKISIKDKATLDNNSKRSRDSKSKLNPKLGYDFQTTGGLAHTGDLSIDAEVEGETSTDSKGGITRSEKIDLLIAAVVTGVLPNGNLIVSGSQEVRVNYEVRELSVAGIVRPRDISTENTIDYDKVAEARISYGGRGRISEVQQPAIGQQLFDLLTPF